MFQPLVPARLLQEGETPVHYAAEIKKSQAHSEFEDTDMMQLMLKYGGDANISTKRVRHDYLQLHM